MWRDHHWDVDYGAVNVSNVDLWYFSQNIWHIWRTERERERSWSYRRRRLRLQSTSSFACLWIGHRSQRSQRAVTSSNFCCHFLPTPRKGENNLAAMAAACCSLYLALCSLMCLATEPRSTIMSVNTQLLCCHTLLEFMNTLITNKQILMNFCHLRNMATTCNLHNKAKKKMRSSGWAFSQWMEFGQEVACLRQKHACKS